MQINPLLCLEKNENVPNLTKVDDLARLGLPERAELLKKQNTVYVLTFQKTRRSLNSYFDCFQQWNRIRHLDLYLRKTSIYNVNTVLSYRHFKPLLSSGKYLTEDSIDFLLSHRDLIEGIWIDVYCIGPCNLNFQFALKQMGKLYYYNKVYPYWLIQHSAFDSFKRGWIFQESRFPEIHPYLLIDHAWIIDSPIFHQLIQYRTGLTNITRNHPFSQFLKKRNYQPDFIDVLYSYLNCELSYESDLDNAIFGVLKEDRDVLNNLPYNGIITTMTVRSHRFNRVFGSSKEYFCFAGEKYLQFIVSEDRSKVQVVHYTISTGQVSSESKQKTETALDSVERCEYLFENGMILEYYKPNENKERMYLPE